MNEPIYIVDGARTPFLKARNRPGPFAASDLATDAGRALLLRQPFAPTELDEVILGCAAPSPDEVNIGRVVALRMGCGQKVPGWTVMRNCASGMQALDSAINNIRAGRSNLVLAGGVDALSRAPLLFSDAMVLWLSQLVRGEDARPARRAAREVPARLSRAGDRPHEGPDRSDRRPADGPDRGEPRVSASASRAREMDAFAARSHAARARRAEGRPLRRRGRAALRRRAASSTRRTTACARTRRSRISRSCKPFFDRKYGNVTAGNSSQVTDGAAWLVLASAARGGAAQARRRIGRIVDSQWAGLDPAQMGLGPVHAATPILQRHGLGLNDLDAWEINEAFAAQVIACVRAWAERRLLPQRARPAGRARHARRGEAQRRRRRDRARPSGRRIGRAHRAAPAQRAASAPAASAAWPRSASAAARAARCWSSAP